METQEENLLDFEDLDFKGSPRRRSTTSTPRGTTISPRRPDPPTTEITNVNLKGLVRALMDGGLNKSIAKVVRQETMLAISDLSETAAGGSRRESSMERPVAATGGRRGSLLGLELVEKFDPDDPDSNIERWLRRIDQLGAMHGWSDYERSAVAQSKLDGAAKRWFGRLDEYDLTWAEWKAKLALAFPLRMDYAVILEELVNRRKLTSETMTTYYHSKLALCDRARVRGADAVSVIIRGLPQELRANAYAARCTTPEALYNTFLVGLENYHGVEARTPVAPRITVPARTSRTDRGERSRCYNCQQVTTHLSRDCPMAKADRCRRCGGQGHWANDCPKRRATGEGVLQDGDGRLLRPHFKKHGDTAALARRNVVRGRKRL